MFLCWRKLFVIILLNLGMGIHAANAAQPLILKLQPVSGLKNFLQQGLSVKPIQTEIDFRQVEHTRLQQFYQGYPVMGGQAVLHRPYKDQVLTPQLLSQYAEGDNSAIKINGMFYQDLSADLSSTPNYIYSKAQADKAKQYAVQLLKKNNFLLKQTKLLVFVDNKNSAHWAFHFEFIEKSSHGLVSRSNYIIDALSMRVLQYWDGIQTLETVVAGGYGGNQKVGKLTYDGLKNDYPVLNLQRDSLTKTCYLANQDVSVHDVQHIPTLMRFSCEAGNKEHANLYWRGESDAINGAFSPANDALYVGKIIKEMYAKWYGIPVLNKNGKPMQLKMLVHEKMENAYWNGEAMVFGDGGPDFYPLVSLSVGAHEISHGFTDQHSHLNYFGQSGGLDESFSDMAAQAAEFYATGKSNWLIGAEITKNKTQALRYMDEPTRDCLPGNKPGKDCSIDNVKDYREDIDVHYSSGIYNKVFYLLSQLPGWNTHKAFNVMEQANAYYWTVSTTFSGAACGVLYAAEDYNYQLEAIKQVLSQVGIATNAC